MDLFSGIGGFALAARWLGWETVGFCEIDPFCRRVLAKHWPGVPNALDVRGPCDEDELQRRIEIDKQARRGTRKHRRKMGRKLLATIRMNSEDWNDYIRRIVRGGRIDVLTGGFPCQDLSAAGNGEGLDGARSGLWFAMLNVIKTVRPRWVVVENVPAIRTRPGAGDERAIDTVLRGLEEAGYTCISLVVGADDVGAPHRRKRAWIVAHSGSGAAGGERTGREARADVGGRCAGAKLVHSYGIGIRCCGLGQPDGTSGAVQGETWQQRVRPDAQCSGESGELGNAEGISSRRLSIGAGPSFSRLGFTGPNIELAHTHRTGRREQRGTVSGGEFLPASELLRDGGTGRAESCMGGAASGLPGWMARGWPAGRGEAQAEWEAPRTVKTCRERAAKLKALGNAVVPANAWAVLSVIDALA